MICYLLTADGAFFVSKSHKETSFLGSLTINSSQVHSTPLLPDASVPLGSSCNSVGITAGKSSCSMVLRISFGKQGYQVSLLAAKS